VRAAADRLARDIKAYIGSSARVELRPAGGIERSMGKARRVVDQRKL
jgi:phenylacetate-CoA ligase